MLSVHAHKESVLSLDLSEDGDLLFSTGGDSVVNVRCLVYLGLMCVWMTMANRCRSGRRGHLLVSTLFTRIMMWAIYSPWLIRPVSRRSTVVARTPVFRYDHLLKERERERE